MGRESSRTLTAAGYRKLAREVGELLAQGRAEAESAVGHVLAVTYWKVGRRIAREKLSEHAGYGSGMVVELAQELEIDEKTLHRAVAFARTYDEPPVPGLSWVHYRELLGLKDARERRWYETRALSEGWTGRTLSAEIRSDRYAQASEAGEGARGKAKLKRPADATHVYKAWVVRVVDGDTLLLPPRERLRPRRRYVLVLPQPLLNERPEMREHACISGLFASASVRRATSRPERSPRPRHISMRSRSPIRPRCRVSSGTRRCASERHSLRTISRSS